MQRMVCNTMVVIGKTFFYDLSISQQIRHRVHDNNDHQKKTKDMLGRIICS